MNSYKFFVRKMKKKRKKRKRKRERVAYQRNCIIICDSLYKYILLDINENEIRGFGYVFGILSKLFLILIEMSVILFIRVLTVRTICDINSNAGY